MGQYVHIGQVEGRFLCGLRANSEDSFVSLKIYLSGDLRPAGQTRFCPFCVGAV